MPGEVWILIKHRPIFTRRKSLGGRISFVVQDSQYAYTASPWSPRICNLRNFYNIEVTINRLLKKAHLLRCSHPSSLRRTFRYASFRPLGFAELPKRHPFGCRRISGRLVDGRSARTARLCRAFKEAPSREPICRAPQEAFIRKPYADLYKRPPRRPTEPF